MEVVVLQFPALDDEPPPTHSFDSKQLARVIYEPLQTGILSQTQSMEYIVMLTTESAVGQGSPRWFMLVYAVATVTAKSITKRGAHYER